MVDIARPETWTVVALLMTAIIALVRGDIIPGRTHDRIVQQLKDEHARTLEGMQEECALWRQIALRGVQLSETSLDVIKRVKK